MAVNVERRPEARTAPIVLAALALSVALHVIAYGAIPRLSFSTASQPEVRDVDVRIVDMPSPNASPSGQMGVQPTPPNPEPVPEAPPSETPPTPRRVRARPPAREAPVRFDNVTLTNKGEGSSWATDPGTGKSAPGPISANGTPTRGSKDGVAGGVPGGTGGATGGPALVPYGQLGRPPVMPSQARLDALLARFYPKAARVQGIEGGAAVQLLIDPDGKIRAPKVKTEKPRGHDFGDACQRMLEALGQVRAGGVDKDGRPVATRINFRCDFRLR